MNKKVDETLAGQKYQIETWEVKCGKCFKTMQVEATSWANAETQFNKKGWKKQEPSTLGCPKHLSPIVGGQWFCEDCINEKMEQVLNRQNG